MILISIESTFNFLYFGVKYIRSSTTEIWHVHQNFQAYLLLEDLPPGSMFRIDMRNLTVCR